MAPANGNAGDESKPATMRAMAAKRVIPFVLAAGFFERLAFFGLTGSLVAFFTKELNMDKGPAASMTSLFQTFTYFAPLVGGYLADARWGCYRTILICFVLSALGVALCAAAAAPGARSSGLFLAGLLACVALGAGGMSPLIVVLGANQYEDKPAAAWVGIRTNTPGTFNVGDTVDVMGIWAIEEAPGTSPGGLATVHVTRTFTSAVH